MMRSLRQAFPVLIAASWVAAAPNSARADPARDPVAAEALFKTALELLEKGDWTAACSKFQASEELDPAVSTLVKLAKCREHEGKLAEAWYTLQQALKLNRDKPDQSEKRRDELETFTKAQLASLEPRVPKLRIVIKGAPAGTTVKRDGKEQPLSTLGEALPVDPGAHEAVAVAAGYVTERRNVSVGEGETIEVVIELSPAPAGAPTVPAGDVTHAETFHSTPAPRGSGRRTAGFVIGGIGAASLAAGGVLGVLTLTKAGNAADDASGNADRDAARGTQTAAFVAAGVGLVALGAGVALVLTAPKRTSGARAALGIRPSSVVVIGNW